MATLFALVYPDQDSADRALETAHGLKEGGFIKIREQAVVTKDEHGKVHHHAEKSPVKSGALAGVLIGGLTGLIFAIPIFGLAIGGALGAYFGKRARSGAEGDFSAFQQSVGEELKPGGSAALLLVDSDARERVIHELSRHGGKLFSHDLSDEQMAEIQREIDKANA
jgi:uncharacterized membrane protein